MKKYYCSQCHKQIDPRNSSCPHCNTVQPFDKRAEALDRELINIKCNNCGCDTSFFSRSKFFDMAYCANCGEETYYDDSGKIDLPKPKQQPLVECPYCHSTNTKKISTTSKVGSAALFGIFSIGKISKEWHCNNCNSNF